MSEVAIERNPTDLKSVQDHWWWRPGWRPGRHFYACHLIPDDIPPLRDLARTYQTATERFGFLDQIPAQWLHITMQGIGFVDEISANEIQEIHAKLTDLLQKTEQPTVTFHRPTIQKEALYLRALPKENLYELQVSMHHAVTSVLGPGKYAGGLLGLEAFGPHLSFAYVNTGASADDIESVLDAVEAEPVTVTFHKADLLVFHRDSRMYEWTSATPITIGAGHPAYCL